VQLTSNRSRRWSECSSGETGRGCLAWTRTGATGSSPWRPHSRSLSPWEQHPRKDPKKYQEKDLVKEQHPRKIKIKSGKVSMFLQRP
jgi:hypothetical protein